MSMLGLVFQERASRQEPPWRVAPSLCASARTTKARKPEPEQLVSYLHVSVIVIGVVVAAVVLVVVVVVVVVVVPVADA